MFAGVLVPELQIAQRDPGQDDEAPFSCAMISQESVVLT
jgi:hypothetical protein